MKALLASITILLATGSINGKIVDAKPSVSWRPNLSCEFSDLDLPEVFSVYAAGSNYSGRERDFQIDQSGRNATQFDVVVNSVTKPVALMLGAYEPTIWNIGWTEGTEIIAVFISGYRRQVVSGLEDTIPLLISTFENDGPCGYLYIDNQPNTELNPLARTLFNHPVDLVFLGDSTGNIVVGDSIGSYTEVVIETSSTRLPDSYRNPDAPLAGQAGLDDALEKGIIRRATLEDADSWVNAVMKNSPDLDVPPIAGQGFPLPDRPALVNAYVILKPFTFPAGLFGGNMATFFIPNGVSIPSGNPGHSTIYDFNSLQCSGALCDL